MVINLALKLVLLLPNKMKKSITKKKQIGFWFNDANTLLPDPNSFIDESDSFENFRVRYVVADYINSMSNGSSYKGYSYCRICGCENGCSDKQDELFICPEGYSHYLTVHNVMPDKDFVNHLRTKISLTKKQQSNIRNLYKKIYKKDL